jgi:hypothetical protein
VIALRRQKHLRFVLEAAEGLAVNDAVAITLIAGTEVILRLVAIAPARLRTARRLRDHRVALDVLEHLADRGHHAHFTATNGV